MSPAVKPAGSVQSICGGSPESPGLIQYVCQPGAIVLAEPDPERLARRDGVALAHELDRDPRTAGPRRRQRHAGTAARPAREATIIRRPTHGAHCAHCRVAGATASRRNASWLRPVEPGIVTNDHPRRIATWMTCASTPWIPRSSRTPIRPTGACAPRTPCTRARSASGCSRRYEDVVAALRDPRLAKEAIAAFVAARFGRRRAGAGPVDARPRPARPHAPARPRQQGLHAARGRRPAPAHPADRRRPARPRREPGRDGPHRGVRLSAARHRHLRDARRARSRTTSASRAGGSTSRAVSTPSAAAGLRRGRSGASPRATRSPTTSASSSPAPRPAARRHALRPHRRRGGGRQAERGRAARHVHPAPRRRSRDDGQPDRQRHARAPAPSRSSSTGCARTPG